MDLRLVFLIAYCIGGLAMFVAIFARELSWKTRIELALQLALTMALLWPATLAILLASYLVEFFVADE